MDNDLQVIEQWIGDLLARLDSKEQARVNRAVGIALRRSQAQRIASQQNPDGSAYEPRKQSKNFRGKKGKIRRKGMFTKLRTQKYLKATSTASEISVGFRGRAAVIALVHQYAKDSRYKNTTFKMPMRKLLGLTEEELEQISNAFLNQLAGK